MVEMYVKVEFEMTKNNVKIFDEWINSKPEKMTSSHPIEIGGILYV